MRHRLDVGLRVLAAIFGGYAVAALAAIAFARTLPLSGIEAAATGTIAALLAWPAAAMGCFWAKNAGRACAGLLLAALLAGGVAAAGGWRP